MEEGWRSEHQITKMVKYLCVRVTLNIHEFCSNALFPRSCTIRRAYTNSRRCVTKTELEHTCWLRKVLLSYMSN